MSTCCMNLQALFLGAVLALTIRCEAVSILTGPSFLPSTNAPLAGSLQLTTDVDTRVSVLVDNGNKVWSKDFYDFGTNHTLPLLGFCELRGRSASEQLFDQCHHGADRRIHPRPSSPEGL